MARLPGQTQIALEWRWSCDQRRQRS